MISPDAASVAVVSSVYIGVWHVARTGLVNLELAINHLDEVLLLCLVQLGILTGRQVAVEVRQRATAAQQILN